MKHFLSTPLLLLACASLTACSVFGDDEELNEPTAEVTAESSESEAGKLYNQARGKLLNKQYPAAIADFEEVERRYPFSDLAIRSQVMAAYTAYEAQDYDLAINILDRYTRLHPGDKSVPYAYYLVALSQYEQISDVGRDQKITELAMQSLTDVLRRFPNTDYARDAKLKLDLTVDHLAGKEMEIGRYYQRRDEFLAAINRFRFVVENYQTTSHTPEALHRLVETYTAIGLEHEANRYAAVLGHNYPSSVWYRDSYQIATGEIVGDATGKDIAAQADDDDEEEGWFKKLIP